MNAISKKPPLLFAQDTHNAQNTLHKLGVAFSYLERNNLVPKYVMQYFNI